MQGQTVLELDQVVGHDWDSSMTELQRMARVAHRLSQAWTRFESGPAAKTPGRDTIGMLSWPESVRVTQRYGEKEVDTSCTSA